MVTRDWRADLVSLHVLLLRQRTQCVMTQQDLADRLGVKVLTIKRWEASHSTPSPKALWRWAAALGVSITGSVAEVSRADTCEAA